MTEHKFTDEDIILAHRCCTDIGMGCLDCPFRNNENAEGCASLNKLGLDLINRQKAEIERLKDNFFGKISASAAVAIADLKEKGEEMERELKAEAVKEFANSIKTYYDHIDKTVGALINYTIDKKLEEFLGEGVVDDA